jgi:hypothetical protein
MMKYYLIAFCILIMATLASAGFFLLKDDNKSAAKQSGKKRMAWALTWRIGLSVLLFASIWLFYLLGWIKPSGLPYQAV